MDFVDYPDREMLAIDVANKLAGELRAALEHEDRVLMAVPGGTTRIPAAARPDLVGILSWYSKGPAPIVRTSVIRK